jgi:hypothetical protein
MLKRFVFSVCTAAVLIGECIQGPETRQGRVEVVATDLTGALISDIDVELTPGRDGAGTIKAKSGGMRVLYGDYRLRVYANGFGYARRDVRVYQPETVVRIELPLGYIGCPNPPAEIAGRVRRSNSAGELWVKAIPVRGVGGNEARVNSAGYFLISGLEYTSYLVAVMQGETALHQQLVKTYPVGSNPRLDIDLVSK